LNGRDKKKKRRNRHRTAEEVEARDRKRLKAKDRRRKVSVTSKVWDDLPVEGLPIDFYQRTRVVIDEAPAV